jgi:hypothetical protein
MKTAFCWGKLNERDEDVDTDRINLAQDRGKWWPIHNIVMNPQLHKIQEISQLCNTLTIPGEEFCSMEKGSYYHSNKVQDFWDTM